MYKNHQNSILTYMKTPLILTDAICSNMAFVAAFFCVKSYGLVAEEALWTNFYTLWVLFNLLNAVAALHLRLYARSTLKQLKKLVYTTWKSVLILLTLFTGCTVIEYRFRGIGYFLIVLAVLVILYVVLSRFLLAYLYKRDARASVHTISKY
ncbi:hypothetical protein FXV77_06670 [Sphingobacterium phlebotomi]|uniref:Uncharacterized protein n=2 Tax=Sphingobacterium phlebotomi TaxID=2605433 RepID=A0A5D4H848_9SPHI|nr:hypothetical protein FXV77_06670 [Sphingobacterium phlebotomi]